MGRGQNIHTFCKHDMLFGQSFVLVLMDGFTESKNCQSIFNDFSNSEDYALDLESNDSSKSESFDSMSTNESYLWTPPAPAPAPAPASQPLSRRIASPRHLVTLVVVVIGPSLVNNSNPAVSAKCLIGSIVNDKRVNSFKKH